MLKSVFAALAMSFVASTASAADFTAIADIERGQSVTVEGVVDRFYDTDEILLRDASGTVRVYLGPKPAALRSGERIVVEGVMDNDLFQNELYAREITRESGEKMSVSGGYE